MAFVFLQVVLGTVIAYFINIEKEYGVKIVGNIPTGYVFKYLVFISFFLNLLYGKVITVRFIICLRQSKFLYKFVGM